MKNKNKRISVGVRRYHRKRKNSLRIRIALCWLFILIGVGTATCAVAYRLRADEIVKNTISIDFIKCENGQWAADCSLAETVLTETIIETVPIRQPENSTEEFYYKFENDLKFRNYILSLSSNGVKRNNPGNLRYARQIHAWGKNGFAAFPNIVIGFRALIKQVEIYQNKNVSIRQFLSRYSPHSENDTEWLIKCMVNELQVPEDTNIKKINTVLLAQYIVKQEYSIKY